MLNTLNKIKEAIAILADPYDYFAKEAEANHSDIIRLHTLTE